MRLGAPTRRSLIGALAAMAATGANLARAKAEAAVSLYTSLDTKIVDAIIQPFQQQYGIKVTYYRGGSADVTSRILAEADAGQVRADVADASDVGAFLAMKQRKLLLPYDSPQTRAVAANLRDPDGTWVADRLTQAVIQWNTQRVGSTPPRGWKDLADARFNGKLAFFSSPNGDGAPRLYTLATAFGWDLLQAYAASHPLRLVSPQVMTTILESGERTSGFLQNDNIAWRSKRQGKPTDYMFPAEGVPTELGAVAVLKDAPHPDAAKLFYDWWMGEPAQKILVDGGKYSSRADLAPPIGNPPLASLKLIIPDNVKLFTERADIIDRMTKIFGGEWGG
ncbi:MAG TPA: extracellular solute-binding protein [Acetobacteraceae bacterium]|nr:extracellular solute-binding protein [Acetobacteraceae bacterium]